MNNTCPKCGSQFAYPTGVLMTCPECNYEWNPEDPVMLTDEITKNVVKDANGNLLQNGDSIIIVKDLPVKGAAKSIKAGTKVKNIRLTDGDHNIDCKVEGFGPMALKSEFVRKA